jgi:hypothetical protein
MADLNSLIAQGAQFRIPPPVDPMGNMPQLMQMRAAQNQNALAQYQLGAAQRTDEQQSALNALARNPNFNPNTPEGMRQAQQYGAPGYALVKSAREASSAGVAQDQARTNLLKEKMAMLPDAYRMADTPEAYAQLQESIHADPVIGPWLNSIGSTKEKGVAALQDALTKPNGFDQLRMRSMKSVKDILEGNKPLVVAAGSSVFDPKSQSFVGTAASNVPDAELMTRMGYPLTREGYAAFKNDQRQDRLRTPEEESQQIRIAQGSRPLPAPRVEPAPRTQQVTLEDGSLGIVNMDTGVITRSTVGGTPVKGKLSALAERQAAAKVQLQKDLTFAITEIGDAIKEGGLIDQSTGSGAGRLADISMGFVGKATPGAIAIGKLQPIADLPLKLVPRFEGPQSNADLKTYQQASAQLADPTLPRAIRKAAGATIVRLMKERQGQFATKDMAPTVENAAKADPKAEAAAYLKSLGVTQ